MNSIKVDSEDVFAAIAPIRYSITYSTNKQIFAFASLNDVCFAKSECLEDPTAANIIKTLPLKKPAACLSFVKSESANSSNDNLLVIDSEGELHVYEVEFDGNSRVTATEVESRNKVDLPSDFCHGQRLGDENVYFWCRRNVLFCKKHGDSEPQQFMLKTDVKCFDSVVYEGIIFCVAGCVNGNVYFLEVDVSAEVFKFTLVGLVNPFPIPVTNVAVKKVDDMIVAAFNHSQKITTVRWELASTGNAGATSMKTKRHLQMAGKNWDLSTDSVIGDFSADVSSLYFNKDGKKLLIVTNERDFGVYVYNKDSEGQFNWINVALGGEAAQRSFGYCGGVLSPSEDKVIVYNTKGAIMVFNLELKSQNFYVSTEAAPPFNGHLSLVTGAHWDPSGQMLFTAGSRSREIQLISKLKDGSLCQIARPESHQYDVQAFCVISGLRIIVGSDELPFRVYQASANYVQSVENLVGLTPDDLRKNEVELPTTPFFKQPVLGVLNVAAGDADYDGGDPQQVGEVFTGRPTVNSLMRFTYWEVIESLYGHTNPAAALAIDPAGEFLATSCHATSPEDAVILVRKMSDWNIVDRLPAHMLTVTKLAFSPDGKYLLSVSRDRSFAVFGKVDEKWALVNRTPEAHSRMIFASSWSPDSRIFLTASRDGQLNAWAMGEAPKLMSSSKMTSAVYSLAVTSAEISVGNKWLLAAGLGDGSVSFFTLNKGDGALEKVVVADTGKGTFSLPVTCLEFRKQSGLWKDKGNGKSNGNEFVLAAGSESGIVKVFTLTCQ